MKISSVPSETGKNHPRIFLVMEMFFMIRKIFLNMRGEEKLKLNRGHIIHCSRRRTPANIRFFFGRGNVIVFIIMRPVYANCSFALLDGFAFIPTRDGGSTTIFYFFLLHLCTTTVGTSVFWTTFVFLRNYLHLYDVSYSSQSERVCGKLYEERSY